MVRFTISPRLQQAIKSARNTGWMEVLNGDTITSKQLISLSRYLEDAGTDFSLDQVLSETQMVFNKPTRHVVMDCQANSQDIRIR